MRNCLLYCCGLGIAALLTAGHASAQEPSRLGIAGFQASPETAYTYVGVIVPFPGAEIGQGAYHKTIASWLGYSYDTTRNGQPVEVEAKAPGIEAGVGYAWSAESYGLDLSATVGYRNIDIEPFVPADERSGDVFTLNPQLQAWYQFAPSIYGDIISSYAIGQDTSFNRVRLGWEPVDTWRTGVEGIWQNGPNHRVEQQGLFAVKQLRNGLSLEVSGGRAEDRNGSTFGYGGIAVAKVF